MEMFTATKLEVFPLTAVIIERLTRDTPVFNSAATVFGTCLRPTDFPSKDRVSYITVLH